MLASIDGGSLAGYTAFNFIMLPGVNDIVDYNTRANYSRKPNPLHIELIADDSTEDYKPIIPEGVESQNADEAANSEAKAEVEEVGFQHKNEVVKVANAMECKAGISLQQVTKESETWILDCGDGESLTVKCFDDTCYLK